VKESVTLRSAARGCVCIASHSSSITTTQSHSPPFWWKPASTPAKWCHQSSRTNSNNSALHFTWMYHSLHCQSSLRGCLAASAWLPTVSSSHTTQESITNKTDS